MELHNIEKIAGDTAELQDLVANLYESLADSEEVDSKINMGAIVNKINQVKKDYDL